jgi:protein involved in polysaccharide export with SLBB domain
MKQIMQIGLTVIALVFVCRAAIIKNGNVLDIRVQNNEQFSGKFTVGRDGTIDYPLLSGVVVSDMTVAELTNDLTYRLVKYVDNPLVLVKVIDQPEIVITILGNVKKAGQITTYQGASLQEVIGSAGGLEERADIEHVKIIRKGGSDADAQFCDFKAFLRDGDYETLPKLADGDIVILLSEKTNRKIKVIGAVNKPGFFDLEEKMNVFELIYLAGGPAEKADMSKVRRFYQNNGKMMEEVLNIQDFIDRGKLDEIPMVNEGDVVIVYSRWFNWAMMLTILNNVLLFIVTIQTLRGALE